MGEGLDEIITSKLTFIDLAGSEKGTSEKQCKFNKIYLLSIKQMLLKKKGFLKEPT